MSQSILRCGERHFQRFIHVLGEGVHQPAAEFTGDLLCGQLFAPDLVLTHVAAKIAFQDHLTAAAKRLRRRLGNPRWSTGDL